MTSRSQQLHAVAQEAATCERCELTTHPSAVLRSRERDAAMDAFVADLRVAGDLLDAVAPRRSRR